MTLPRWYFLLRYHRPAQFYWRIVQQIRRRILPCPPRSLASPVDARTLSLHDNPGIDAILDRRLSGRMAPPDFSERLTLLHRGTFRFLQQERTLGDPIDWSVQAGAPVSHLWRFHLQYHEYLLDLLAAYCVHGSQEAHRRLWDIVADWIDNNRLCRGALGDAWHPFCLSRRIPVWLLLCKAGAPPDELRDTFVVSLEKQASFLESHLERDLGGNHLLENLRALVLMGAFAEGPRSDDRLDHALRQFQEQLTMQVLDSGEHFERSPMYHVLMLEAVIDVRDATAHVRPEVSQGLAEVACRMARFLSGILHPDGDIPLLGDSIFGETLTPGVLIQQSSAAELGEKSSDGMLTGDYWSWRDGDDFVLFDTGPVGTDELPAHAHCDLLNLEASLGGHRLFVDTGVMEYDGPTRTVCRSTAAHNVLQIDDVEQCDVWSRFRMGYRGHPTSCACGHSEGFDWCQATHNAYRRIGVLEVGRWLSCRPGGPWLCVDWARGQGSHRLVSRLHLHPAVNLEVTTATSLKIEVSGTQAELQLCSPGRMVVEDAEWFPKFGCREQAKVVRFEWESPLPAALVWGLVRPGRQGRASHAFHDDGRQQLSWCDDQGEQMWDISSG